jgi:RNase H-fold protein (predicted Holliday junction resolvase)
MVNMTREEEIILGISPGTRTIGTAVYKEGEFVEWKIKAFNEKWSEEKLEKIRKYIIGVIKAHQISCITLKTPHTERSSPDLEKVVQMIEKIAHKQGIEVWGYTLEDIKQLCQEGYKINKYHLAEYISRQNPELKYELQRHQEKPSAYYLKVFETIACILFFLTM